MNSDNKLLEVVIHGTREGLGIRIVGGYSTATNSEDFGIFVKEVLRGTLADKDGQLQRGDQLMEANGTSLVGVSNQFAVSTLQTCAKTNTIKLLVSRSPNSRDEFRRLSNSILLQPIPNVGKGGREPVATSTPREGDTAKTSSRTVTEEPSNTRPSSAASSNLTQVTTDLDSEDELVPTTPTERTIVSSPSTEVAALSDVMVSIPSPSHHTHSTPPPLPDTAPPMFDEDSFTAAQRQKRVTPERKATSPPLSAGATRYSCVVPKERGLGLVIGGGVKRQDGPHIFIEKILHDLDAAKDGQLKKGDRILSMNGTQFNNVTREYALTIITQLKIRPQVKAYTVVIERDRDINSSLPPPERSHKSIFDTDTLPVTSQQEEISVNSSSVREEPLRKTTPQRYLAKKGSMGRTEGSRYDSLHKRMSMEPSARVKLDKLEWALNYMGYLITSEQQTEIHERLSVGEDGRVVFADFVSLARELFAFKLDDTRLEANLMYALTQKDSLELPALPRKATSVDHLAMDYSPYPSQLKLAISQPHILVESSPPDDLGAMRQQLHDIGQRRERLNQSLNSLLTDQMSPSHTLQESVLSKSPAAVMKGEYTDSEETLKLQRRVGLAEAAAKASRDKAHQLEEEMRGMVAKLALLRGEQSMQQERSVSGNPALECELRKERAVSRRYQVATENLLQFVENCHEALIKSPDADRILYHLHGEGVSVTRGDAVRGNPRPPQYLSRHAKMTATSLAVEAKETIAAVQKLLQVEALPYGWDIQYTEDGEKYYINHEMKTTSWVHPLTKTHTTPGTRASTPSSQTSHRP